MQQPNRIEFIPSGVAMLIVEPQAVRRMRANEERESMSEEIVRCPYCVMGSEFRPMLPRFRETEFVCVSCGHVATPDDPYLKCPCSRCVDMSRLASRRRSSEDLRRRDTADLPFRL